MSVAWKIMADSKYGIMYYLVRHYPVATANPANPSFIGIKISASKPPFLSPARSLFACDVLFKKTGDSATKSIFDTLTDDSDVILMGAKDRETVMKYGQVVEKVRVYTTLIHINSY